MPICTYHSRPCPAATGGGGACTEVASRGVGGTGGGVGLAALGSGAGALAEVMGRLCASFSVGGGAGLFSTFAVSTGLFSAGRGAAGFAGLSAAGFAGLVSAVLCAGAAPEGMAETSAGRPGPLAARAGAAPALGGGAEASACAGAPACGPAAAAVAAASFGSTA